MALYNFLSGSSIDNVTNFLFDNLQSGDCYLGYSRGVPELQWGISAMVFVEHSTIADNSSFPICVAKSGDIYTAEKFFDLNSVNLVSGTTDVNRELFIGKVLNTDTTFSNVEYLSTDTIGELSLSYVGEDWMVIEGLSKYYYELITPSVSASYYIFNYTKNNIYATKILNKSFVNIPYYTTSCNLYMKADGETEYTLIKSNLQRTINIIGESYVTGMFAPETIAASGQDAVFIENTINKTTLLNASFILKDTSGNILIENMDFVDPESGNPSGIYTEINSLGNSSKYIAFKYPYVNAELQYIKFMVGTKQNDELAIWNEMLPYNTAIPTSDSNPPGLDVSYLKNPGLSTSIFDVKGLVQILPEEVTFVKELFNNTEEATYTNLGFEIEEIELNGPNTEHLGIVKYFTQAGSGATIVQLNDFHTFVVGDIIVDPTVPEITYTVIGVDYSFGSSYIALNRSLVTDLAKNYVLTSNPSSVTARIKLAKTTDKKKALKYGFVAVLVNKIVDLVGVNSPTEDIYRQLFICYKPKDSTGNICDSFIHRTIFNSTDFVYDVGTVMYICNKIPIYRKWANISEEFKIIL